MRRRRTICYHALTYNNIYIQKKEHLELGELNQKRGQSHTYHLFSAKI